MQYGTDSIPNLKTKNIDIPGVYYHYSTGILKYKHANKGKKERKVI